MNGIQVKNFSVRYNGQSVLEDIDFKADTGEFIVIVGKSGSGKTTFLHALAGLIPCSGEKVISEKVGMIFQQYTVFPWLTVAENIAFGLDDTSSVGRQSAVLEHVALAGLEEKRDKYPAELSGGQIQRVALARTLVLRPQVLLMDEPYGALDAHTRGLMQQWLLDVWTRHKTTVIFVTHDIEEAIFLADRVLVLNNGTFTRTFSVPFPRPREETIKFMPKFGRLRKEIFESMGSASTFSGNPL